VQYLWRDEWKLEKVDMAREYRPSLNERLRQAMGMSQHQPSISRGKVICSSCTKKTGKREALRWLVDPFRHTFQGVHSSHTPFFRKGVLFCLSCGCGKVKRSSRLPQPCKGLRRYGKAVLRGLERGLPPRGLLRWPQDGGVFHACPHLELGCSQVCQWLCIAASLLSLHACACAVRWGFAEG